MIKQDPIKPKCNTNNWLRLIDEWPMSDKA